MSGAVKEKIRPRKTLPQKRKLFRSLDPMMSVFAWGINHTISELKQIPPPPILMPEDYKAYSKIKVENHNFAKDVMPSHWKFKEYCPQVFRMLRELFGVTAQRYSTSLSKEPLEELSEQGSNQTSYDRSRSAARFFTSRDDAFTVKTISSDEVEMMHAMLKQYYQFVVEQSGTTLLPHFYGMYRQTVNDHEHYVLVMRNAFAGRGVHHKYDLKGSTVDRQASDKEKSRSNLPTLKDNDFIAGERKLYLSEEAKAQLTATLTRDVDFLTMLNLMDYSLLVGIQDLNLPEVRRQQSAGDQEESPEEDEPVGDALPALSRTRTISQERGKNESRMSRMQSADEDGGPTDDELTCLEEWRDIAFVESPPDAPVRHRYCFMIVDVLTDYSLKKKTAHTAKTVIRRPSVKYGANSEISTIAPSAYAKRFLEFVATILA